MENYIEQYGMMVLRLRKKEGLSQAAFALKADINRTYLSDIEKGRNAVSLRCQCKIAEAFGSTPARMLQKVERKTKKLKVKKENNM